MKRYTSLFKESVDPSIEPYKKGDELMFKPYGSGWVTGELVRSPKKINEFPWTWEAKVKVDFPPGKYPRPVTVLYNSQNNNWEEVD